jgi:hypothetical protein
MQGSPSSNFIYNLEIREDVKRIIESNKPEEWRQEFGKTYDDLGKALNHNDQYGVMMSAQYLYGLALSLCEVELKIHVKEFMNTYTCENINQIIEESTIAKGISKNK